MKITKLARRGGKALFQSCHVNGLLDESRVRATVTMVISRKPRGFLGILKHFQRLVRLDMERRNARVESATPLSPTLQASVSSNLTRIYGAGVNVTFSENPSLIGGLRVKVGSDLYDGTIEARLAGLQENFSA